MIPIYQSPPEVTAASLLAFNVNANPENEYYNMASQSVFHSNGCEPQYHQHSHLQNHDYQHHHHHQQDSASYNYMQQAHPQYPTHSHHHESYHNQMSNSDSGYFMSRENIDDSSYANCFTGNDEANSMAPKMTSSQRYTYNNENYAYNDPYSTSSVHNQAVPFDASQAFATFAPNIVAPHVITVTALNRNDKQDWVY